MAKPKRAASTGVTSARSKSPASGKSTGRASSGARATSRAKRPAKGAGTSAGGLLGERAQTLLPVEFRAAQVNQDEGWLTAYASVRSKGGVSLFSGQAKIDKSTVNEFTSTDADKRTACSKMLAMGFEIQRVGPLVVRVRAPAKLFTKHLGVKFHRDTPTAAGAGYKMPVGLRGMTSAALAAAGGPKGSMPAILPSPLTPTFETLANLLNTGIPEIEGLVFPEAVQLHAPPSATPPALNYHHLKVPNDIVRLLNAKKVHQGGHKGQNVRVAMIDSGFHWKHPYFAGKGYSLKVELPKDSDADANGHGTGESANFLAVAPKAKLYGLSMADIVAAFQVARDTLGVQVITNSWGSLYDTDGPNGMWHPYWATVQAEIALCAAQGIIVMFSGGNGGMSFTASMPETISVGGAYVDDKGAVFASNYASSFASTRFAGQQVPDVCGLCGQTPGATYIALPIPPGCEIDKQRGGPSFPAKDETKKNDGWGVFSGTSAACPMVAGVVALLLNKHPGEDLAGVRQRLAKATDVTQGQSAMGDAAAAGQDLATGYGLVDAARACT